MKAIYLGSFDPAHYGHRNTYEKAKRLLQCDIQIGICSNMLKMSPWFTTDERLLIAKSVFQTDDIVICNTMEEVINTVQKAHYIVRGYTTENDKQYALKLAKLYNVNEHEKKVQFVKIDEEYQNISSSNIKNMMKTNPEAVKKLISETGYNMLLNKIAIMYD